MSLARTPPMGWNSWNQFGPKVDQDKVLAAAKLMATGGYRQLGYEYVVIDDCWSEKQRDSLGNLVPDRERFSEGIAALAKEVHGLGLKLGIYSDAAEKTCGGYLGSLGFEEQDARLWAGWGVDFLKYDYCHAPLDQASAIERYTAMGQALQASGREMLYSICEWGGRAPETWARQAGGQMWRASADVFDSWVDVWVPQPGYYGAGIDSAFDLAARLAPSGGPGGWNDLDMLVVGLQGKGQVHGNGLSGLEYRTHMTLWAMACSPLMMGCDLRSLDAHSESLLTNVEIIGVNQDLLGVPAQRVRQWDRCEAWLKPSSDGSIIVALFNRGSQGADIELRASDLGLKNGAKALRDLWAQADAGELGESRHFRVQPHDSMMLKVSSQ